MANVAHCPAAIFVAPCRLSAAAAATTIRCWAANVALIRRRSGAATTNLTMWLRGGRHRAGAVATTIRRRAANLARIRRQGGAVTTARK